MGYIGGPVCINMGVNKNVTQVTHRAEGFANVSLLQEERIVVPDDGPREMVWNTGHGDLKQTK
jgi:hypothetical protein